MHKVVFYEDSKGKSELYEQLLELANKAESSKDSRIQIRQITLYIDLLKQSGLQLPKKVAKHLKNELWELRPGNNRIMFFYHINDTFVLLHMFRKQTQKTPAKEIEKAFREINDYLNRFGGIKQ